MAMAIQAARPRAATTAPRTNGAPDLTHDHVAFAAARAALQRSVARDTGAPRTVVEDGISHAFEQLCRHPTRPETVLSWLRVVARHEVWRLMRRLRREPLTGDICQPAGHNGERRSINPGEQVPDPHTLELAVEARQALRTLAALGDNQRQTVTLGVSGHSYAEIQRIRGVTLTNVNRHMHEGRARARALHSTGEEPTPA
ncbi:MAG: hypothetical protein MSC31_15190 [Solirubrobacteraceae bacterium MAG38_C4-C5]|nr:hypothetical protein [Candidatus Siliceabacter maunaloa]